MVYASLSSGMTTITLLAVLGGFGLIPCRPIPWECPSCHCLSLGFAVHQFSHLILRDQTYAQLVLGFAAAGSPRFLRCSFCFHAEPNP